MKDPERLIEAVEQEIFAKLVMNPYWMNIQLNIELCRGIAQYVSKDATRIVLQAVQRGEVVEIKGSGNFEDGDYEEHLELTTAFKEWMDEK